MMVAEERCIKIGMVTDPIVLAEVEAAIRVLPGTVPSIPKITPPVLDPKFKLLKGEVTGHRSKVGASPAYLQLLAGLSDAMVTPPQTIRDSRTRATYTGEGVRSAGRNQPCPCGSGRKYKLCHGK